MGLALLGNGASGGMFDPVTGDPVVTPPESSDDDEPGVNGGTNTDPADPEGGTGADPDDPEGGLGGDPTEPPGGENIENEDVPLKTIEFTIDGTTFTANENQTFVSWCSSDFNTEGIVCGEDSVLKSEHSDYTLEDANGYHIRKNSIIEEGMAYSWKAPERNLITFDVSGPAYQKTLSCFEGDSFIAWSHSEHADPRLVVTEERVSFNPVSAISAFALDGLAGNLYTLVDRDGNPVKGTDIVKDTYVYNWTVQFYGGCSKYHDVEVILYPEGGIHNGPSLAEKMITKGMTWREMYAAGCTCWDIINENGEEYVAYNGYRLINHERATMFSRPNDIAFNTSYGKPVIYLAAHEATVMDEGSRLFVNFRDNNTWKQVVNAGRRYLSTSGQNALNVYDKLTVDNDYVYYDGNKIMLEDTWIKPNDSIIKYESYTVDHRGPMLDIPDIGPVETSDPNVDVYYDPDTGDLTVAPPIEEIPEEPIIPKELPPQAIDPVIDFKYGEFETSIHFNPGQEITVEYEVSETITKDPGPYKNIDWAGWNFNWLTDANGRLYLETTPREIDLMEVEDKYYPYVVYSRDVLGNMTINDVIGDHTRLYWPDNAYDGATKSQEAVVYLAAYLRKQTGSEDFRVARWNGTGYVADSTLDKQVENVIEFVMTKKKILTKTVTVEQPSTEVNRLFIEKGELTAKKGMTWRQWLESDYNTTGYSANDVVIRSKDYGTVYSLDSVIEAGITYGFHELPTVSGGWLFNEDLTMSGNGFVQNVDFIVNDRSGTSLNIGNGNVLDLDYNLGDFNWDGKPLMTDAYSDSWNDPRYRYVQFPTTQKVSNEFYEFLCANAIMVEFEDITIIQDSSSVAGQIPINNYKAHYYPGLSWYEQFSIFGTMEFSYNGNSYPLFTHADGVIIVRAFVADELDPAPRGYRHVGKDETITDAIEYYIYKAPSNQMYLVTPDPNYVEPITFTLDGKTLEAEPGMTWEAWVSGDFSTFDGSAEITKEFFDSSNTKIIVDSKGTAQLLTDIIQSGEVYKITDKAPVYPTPKGEEPMPDGFSNYTYRTFSAAQLGFTGSETSVKIPLWVIYGNELFKVGEVTGFSNFTNLKSVEFPEGLLRIGEYAFQGCTSLEGTLVLPDSLVEIGRSAFEGCTGITSIDWGSNITKLGWYCFDNCSGLTDTLTIPGSIVDMGSAPDYITESSANIGTAFSDCTGIKKIVIEEGLRKLRGGDFWGCNSVTEVVLPNSLELIEDYSFRDCTKLSSITMGNNLKEIGYQGFYNCKNLYFVALPATISRIDTQAFYGCSTLASVMFYNTSGWKAGSTSLTLSMPSYNATYLKSTYYKQVFTNSMPNPGTNSKEYPVIIINDVLRRSHYGITAPDYSITHYSTDGGNTWISVDTEAAIVRVNAAPGFMIKGTSVSSSAYNLKVSKVGGKYAQTTLTPAINTSTTYNVDTGMYDFVATVNNFDNGVYITKS